MNPRFAARYGIPSLLVLASLGVASHHASADAPARRYSIIAGTVVDTKTGLVWQRIVQVAVYQTWMQATTSCTSNTAALPGAGWRVPSMKELQTIVDDSRHQPAIDPNAFPATQFEANYWTSSPVVGSGNVWSIGFFDGLTSKDNPNSTFYVRCVR